MDEIACWIDMPSRTAVTLTGVCSVPLKTTGHDKDHFIVVLTAKAQGATLRHLVAFKGKVT